MTFVFAVTVMTQRTSGKQKKQTEVKIKGIKERKRNSSKSIVSQLEQ